jgi:hypothetical protein
MPGSTATTAQGSGSTAKGTVSSPKHFPTDRSFTDDTSTMSAAVQASSLWQTANLSIGTFENGTYSYGTYTWPNGDKYQGPFASGKMNGKGAFTRSNGDNSTGVWVDDQKNGQFTETFSDGSQFQGQYINNVRSGSGKLVMANGQSFEGIFENGAYSYGTYTWPNGDKYIGSFIAGSMFYDGKYYHSNGYVASYVGGNEQP